MIWRKIIGHLPHAIIAGVIAYLVAPAFDRTPPVTYEQVVAEPSNAMPGEVIRLHVKAVWRRSCTGTSTFVWTDVSGAIHVTGTVAVNPPPQLSHQQSYTVTRVVPILKPGPGYYMGVLRFNCSFFWPITVHSPRVPIDIRPAPATSIRLAAPPSIGPEPPI